MENGEERRRKERKGKERRRKGRGETARSRVSGCQRPKGNGSGVESEERRSGVRKRAIYCMRRV